MTVELILRNKGPKVVTIRPDQALIEAADMLAENRIGAAVVCDGKSLIGIVSERDIVSGLSRNRAQALSQPVKMFMSSPVITCSPKDKAKHIMEIMTNRRVRHLPVVRDDRVIGMISIGDVIKYRMAENQMELAVLRDYAIAAR